MADINPQLIDTYKTIRALPREVANALSNWPPTKEGYLQARKEVPSTPVSSAARFLFLNRYAFNGVYRENQRGQFNVPFGGRRNGRLPTSAELEEFAAVTKDVIFECSDFESVLDNAQEDDFVYLDPPYHYGNNRNRGEYGTGAFVDEDLLRFRNAVARAHRRDVRILISYNRAHALIRNLPNWKLGYFSVRRSVAGFSTARRSVREYLVRNY